MQNAARGRREEHRRELEEDSEDFEDTSEEAVARKRWKELARQLRALQMSFRSQQEGEEKEYHATHGGTKRRRKHRQKVT